MLGKISSTVSKYALIDENDTIIVALSGGADSVALLYALNKLRDYMVFNLSACHVNHNIRGEEAKRDQDFCREFCDKLGISLYLYSPDVPKISNEKKISLELAGRQVRYEIFGELIHSKNAKIATAHTASDNLETILYNIARGCGLDGLCGIPVQRTGYIRPLIDVTRDDVEKYCADNALEYMTDSTNLSDDYTRNKIRHNIIPVLKEINPLAEQKAKVMSGYLNDVSYYLYEVAKKSLEGMKTKYGYDCQKLLTLENVVLEQALIYILKSNGIYGFDKRHIDLCKEVINFEGAVDLPNGYRVLSKQNTFRIIKPITNFKPLNTAIIDNMKVEFCGKEYKFKFCSAKGTEKGSIYIPLSGNITPEFRTRREGDNFTLAKRNVSKSLKKLFNEMKIPAELRDTITMVSQNDVILWCENIGLSKTALEFNDNTDKFIKISINHHINEI